MKSTLPIHLRFYIQGLLFLMLGFLPSCSAVPALIANPPITHIRIVMDNNYPPYAFVDAQGNMQGILIDQWKLWEKRTGVKVDITGLPWDIALEQMKTGKFDVIDTIFYTDERAKIFNYTKPYANIDVRIFFPNNVSGIANVGNLKGFRVAVKKGDANSDYLLNQGITSLVYYDSYEEIVQAAARKDETIFVMDQPPALYFLYKYDIQDQFNYSEPLYGGQFHRAVKKGNTDILSLVNGGFSRISAKEYQEINNRWFGKSQITDLDEIMPYLGSGIILTLLFICILIIFNRTLQTRVRNRTAELEKALSSLRDSEARFRASIEFLPIPISIADGQGNLLEINRIFTEYYGYNLEDISVIPKWMESAYPDPNYRKMVVAQWDKDVALAIRNQTTTPLREYKVSDKNGRQHDVEIIMSPAGSLWVTSFVDITERKRMEGNLSQQLEHLRALRKIDQFIITSIDLNTNLEILVREIIDQLHVDAASILLLKEKTLHFAAGQGLRTDALKFTHLKIGDGLAGRAAQERKNIYISNLQEMNNNATLAHSLEDEGFIAYYGIPLIAKDQLLGVLEIFHRSPLDNNPDWLSFLETLAGQAAISIDNATLFSDLQKSNTELKLAYDTTLEGWSHAMDLRDRETEGHTRRVTELTLQLAREFGLGEEELVHIKRGGLLHDIGKMGIPDSILLKPGKLTEDEWGIMRKHPDFAYNMLSPIQYLQPALDIPYCHHEKWDGGGYPRGLRGEEIPLSVRIFAVVDVWDALTSNRPYRAAWSKQKAITYMREESGKHFDPRAVALFLTLLEKGGI